MRVLERGDPRPFSLPGGPTGCLLLHGLPGSPAEMRLLGEYLAARNICVHVPLLPGMGTVPEDLGRVSWRDWVSTAEQALAGLRGSCDKLYVAGLSMGGALALLLGASQPLAGVAALAPAIRMRDRRFRWVPLLYRLHPWIEPNHAEDDLADPAARALTWHCQRYPSVAAAQLFHLVRATRRSLPEVRCPVLIVQSPWDSLLDPAGAGWAIEQIGASDKELVRLERSGHNIAVDAEREQVFAQVYRFVARTSGAEVNQRPAGGPAIAK